MLNPGFKIKDNLEIAFQDKFNLYFIQKSLHFDNLATLMKQKKDFSEKEIKYVAICSLRGTNFDY